MTTLTVVVTITISEWCDVDDENGDDDNDDDGFDDDENDVDNKTNNHRDNNNHVDRHKMMIPIMMIEKN